MSCKTNNKRLDTLKKRKTVIHNLFKKDKKTGQILLRSESQLLYEKPGDKLKSNLEFFSVCQIESINKNYSDIYVKQVVFGPPLLNLEKVQHVHHAEKKDTNQTE